MKTPRLFVPSLILAAALLGCGKKLEEEKSTYSYFGSAGEKAEKGDADAQRRLGDMYESGFGVAKDAVEAVKWYRKAAIQGNPFGQLYLARMYGYGLGVTKDNVEAYKWFLLAEAQRTGVAEGDISYSERHLTAAQRAEGRRRADEFKKK